MKTTQKSFLLLGLCTLFGFLVYVDFQQNGLQGDAKKRVSNEALKNRKKANSSIIGQQDDIFSWLEELSKKRQRPYDLENLEKTKKAVFLIKKKKEEFLEGKIPPSEILMAITTLGEELHEIDTALKIVMPAKSIAWGKLKEDIRREYFANYFIQLEAQVINRMAAYIGEDSMWIIDYAHYYFELYSLYLQLQEKQLHRSRPRG